MVAVVYKGALREYNRIMRKYFIIIMGLSILFIISLVWLGLAQTPIITSTGCTQDLDCGLSFYTGEPFCRNNTIQRWFILKQCKQNNCVTTLKTINTTDCPECQNLSKTCFQPKTTKMPTCFDEIRNQFEEGVDCGGPACTPCPTCTDNIQNQGETQTDCGGPCKPCETCFDKIRNQKEESIDCGGPNC
ncbi:Uncharacterised protein [uncultured archaeon]|nr:Uncharacterised protein [uncultured archaeon]